MKGLDPIIDRMEQEFDEKDRVREEALKASRVITRLAASALRGMHRGEDAADAIAEMKRQVVDLRELLRAHPQYWFCGFTESALQEVAEAAIVQSILTDSPVPEAADLGITDSAFLLGLGDAVGELRRFALDHMRHGQIEEANQKLHEMEEIYDVLLRFDHPNAVLALRRKQDVVRSLLERTRGELTVSTRGVEVERKLDSLSKKI